MKTLVMLLIVFSVHRGADCSAFTDFVSGKLNELARSVAGTLRDLRAKVRNFFYSNIVFDEDTWATTKKPALRAKRIRDDAGSVTVDGTKNTGYVNWKTDPSSTMSTPQLATLHGRRAESHVVQTKDGYQLTLHRILPHLTAHSGRATNKTVILHHGLLGSSADWILLGPENSLPYILSDAGYDVWMANARGNVYSQGHISIKRHTDLFWKFTWQEMGEYDLPAVIDYIRNMKNTSEPIDFVGHSMGGSALLVLLSTAPEYNRYLRIGVLLAPLAFMSNIESPVKQLASIAYIPEDPLLRLIGKGEFMPSRKIPVWLALKRCKGPVVYCTNPLFFLSGAPLVMNRSSTFMARLMYHIPAGASTDTILHYAEMVKSGKFHKYHDVNSEFPLNRVSLPIALFSSGDDKLSTVADVLKLYHSIASPIDHYIIRGKNITHTDFVWGIEAPVLVFGKVVEFLDNGLNWNLIKTNEVGSNDVSL